MAHTSAASGPLLEMKGIFKRFPGVQALDNVDLELYRGEILGLIGENGAGKSTLMRVLGGDYAPDSGFILFDGKPVSLRDVRDSMARGVSIIHQELNLAPNLDIATNIFLGREPRNGPLGIVDRKTLYARAGELASRVGISAPLTTLVEKLSPGEQQLVEVAKSLSVDARILVLDEPTSSLTPTEAAKLFEVMLRLKEQGVSMIYISHRLAEVQQMCDRVIVLRDGQRVGELVRKEHHVPPLPEGEGWGEGEASGEEEAWSEGEASGEGEAWSEGEASGEREAWSEGEASRSTGKSVPGRASAGNLSPLPPAEAEMAEQISATPASGDRFPGRSEDRAPDDEPPGRSEGCAPDDEPPGRSEGRAPDDEPPGRSGSAQVTNHKSQIANPIDPSEMIKLMVGRDISRFFPEHADVRRDAEVVLSVRGFRYPGGKGEVSFDLRSGEILGVAGLVGAGRTELVRSLFGIDRRERGEVLIRGERASIRTPVDAIRRGIGLVPEDRKQLGVILEMAVRENVSLSSIGTYRPPFMDRARERLAAEGMVAALDIKTPSLDQQVQFLSGGNQQKVALAKWLCLSPSILILDEPTRGIDVGSKSEIYKLIRSLADKGVGVIMVSSELEEIIGLSDRVLVMHEGRCTGLLEREQISEESIMRLATGGVVT